mmetsp:Transcript_1572/g.5386  ORF Transcript_1572/g.5386 Transcript_1572/m.5386 type:complete len:477 (+) Transcript_1572:87-1517(+)
MPAATVEEGEPGRAARPPRKGPSTSSPSATAPDTAAATKRSSKRANEVEGGTVEQRPAKMLRGVGRAGCAAAVADRGVEGKGAGGALRFEVLGTCGRARCSRLTFPKRGEWAAETPMFMPVGTQGSVKGLTTHQLLATGTQVILGNTYHLENRPGSELLSRLGGLHKFQGWPQGMLTDSGGFQMVSLLDLADITEEGVTFQAPTTGERLLLTPERSIQIQNNIGADIIMALDDVVSSVTEDDERFTEATYRTLRWIDRCIAAHSRPHEQSLFGIVQGGLDPELRRVCLEGLIARGDDLPGYAVGGLAGGEDKGQFWRVVAQCTAALPADKPRYVMGVGYPLDIVVCSALGADMYDCVYPTRTARFGSALVPSGVLKLTQSCYAEDERPIDEECSCETCKRYSRAYLHNLARKEPSGSQLISLHNIAYMARFTREMRQAILAGTFPQYVRTFVSRHYPEGGAPKWVREALHAAGIDL